MELGPDEAELVGKWVMQDGSLVADVTETRIQALITNFLHEVRAGDWCKLFVDPTTGDYWELTYPQSEIHSGGPMKLSRIDAGEAQLKYEL